MGPSCTVSEINGDSSRKSQIFDHPRVFYAHAEGVPLGIEYRRLGSNKLEWWATGPRKKFDDIFNRVDTITVTRTERRAVKKVMYGIERNSTCQQTTGKGTRMISEHLNPGEGPHGIRKWKRFYVCLLFYFFLNKTCFNVLKFVNGCPAPGGEAMFWHSRRHIGYVR